jgi:hypothetical protein
VSSDVVADLAGEHEALDALVAPLSEAGWHTATPADGWDVADTITWPCPTRRPWAR